MMNTIEMSCVAVASITISYLLTRITQLSRTVEYLRNDKVSFMDLMMKIEELRKELSKK